MCNLENEEKAAKKINNWQKKNTELWGNLPEEYKKMLNSATGKDKAMEAEQKEAERRNKNFLYFKNLEN